MAIFTDTSVSASWSMGELKVGMTTSEGSNFTENLGYFNINSFNEKDIEKDRNNQRVYNFAANLAALTTNSVTKIRIQYDYNLN